MKKRRLKQCQVQEGKYSTMQRKLTEFSKRKDKERQKEKEYVMPELAVSIREPTSRYR
jgi:hypothetical protein